RLDPFAQGGDRLGAHAVQARGRLVRPLVKLGARPGDGQHHLQGRQPQLRVGLNGNAAAVVGDAEAPVHVDLDVNVLAKAGQGLIDTVVNQLVDQVVQTAATGVADVHARPLPDVSGVAQYLDVVGLVVVGAVGRYRLPVDDGGPRVNNFYGAWVTHKAL